MQLSCLPETVQMPNVLSL